MKTYKIIIRIKETDKTILERVYIIKNETEKKAKKEALDLFKNTHFIMGKRPKVSSYKIND